MNKIHILIIGLLATSYGFSQENSTLIDGTIGVVGNKVILHSEIEEQLAQAKQQGYNLGSDSRCLIYEEIMFQSLLMYQADAEKLTELFNTVTGGVSFNIIAIKNDLSHIIKIHSALSKNEFVCLHADRNMPGAKTLEADFFGKKAKFPQGPFQMASKFNAPVCFVYNVKKTNFHYQLSCSKPIEGKFSAEEILKKYINTFEEKTKENPTQWFNFYNFFN